MVDPNMLLVIAALLLVVLVVTAIVRAVQIIPQATAAVVERLGRFKAVEDPGLVFLVPFVDKIRARIDLREQVRSFPPQPVITRDNLTVNIDTVVYYQVTDPKSAVYEIADYINGVEQTTITTLRNVVGGMSLEETLTARDEINSQLRGELDKVTGGWGIRIARVEIKAIEPPASIQDSMERQMKADREKRAVILTAEGQRESAIRSAEGLKQSQILTAEGAKQAAILGAEADRQSRILRAQGERAAQYLQAQGEAKAIEKVFAAIKSGRPTPELLAYQYLQTLPQMAQGDANKVWIVPSDFGKALEGFTKMLGAPGGDGVFRFEPSPVDDAPSVRPEDDDEAIKDWFDTSSDPEIARVVADAEAEARAEIPPPFPPAPPAPAVNSAPRPGELPSRTPDELPASAGDGRVGLPAGANRYASTDHPPASTDRSSAPADRSPSPAPWPRSGGSAGPSAPAQTSWSDQPHDAPPVPRGGAAPVPPHPAGAVRPRERRAHPTPGHPPRRRRPRHRGTRQSGPPRLPLPAAVAPQLTDPGRTDPKGTGSARPAAAPTTPRCACGTPVRPPVGRVRSVVAWWIPSASGMRRARPAESGGGGLGGALGGLARDRVERAAAGPPHGREDAADGEVDAAYLEQRGVAELVGERPLIAVDLALVRRRKRAVADAEGRERLREAEELAVLQQPHPEVEIHDGRLVRPPPARGREVVAPEHHVARLADRVGSVAHDPAGHLDPAVHADQPGEAAPRHDDAALLVDHVAARCDQREPRVGLHRPDLQLQAARVDEVVGADELDQRRAAELDEPVPVFGQRQDRGVALDPHPPVAERSGDLAAAIRTAVVQHDQLEIAVRLIQHAADRFPEVGLAVVHRNAHGDARGGQQHVRDGSRPRRWSV